MSLRFKIVILTVIISVIALGAMGYLAALEVNQRVTAQLRDKALLTVSIFDADVGTQEAILDSAQIQGRIDQLVKERLEIARFTFNGPVYGEAEITGYRALASSDPTLIWGEPRQEVMEAIARDEVVARTTTSTDGQPAVELIAPLHVLEKALAAVEVVTTIEAGETADAARDRALWIAWAVDANLDTTEDLLNSVRLQRTITNLAQGQPEIATISLYGPVYQQPPILEYRKTASTDRQAVGEVSEPEAVAPIISDETVVTPVMMEGKEFLRVVAPIHVARKAVATADVLVSLDEVQAETKRIISLFTLATSAAATLMAIFLLVLLGQTVIRPLSQLTASAQAIAGGDLLQEIKISSRDEVGVLANAFNSMAAQLRELIGSLEQRVAERTHEYEEAVLRTQQAYAQLYETHQRLEITTYQAQRRAMQLETAAEVSHAATSVLDPDELMRQAVDLIRDRFDLYYAGLFLLDESGRWAVLRAGTGEPGRQMLKAGHRLEVGGRSMVGWCTANAQARIALDVGEEAVRFDNPLLPETRSEMALPLASRGRVIGALDVQSVEAGAFSDEDISVLQIMADQIAVAIDNARLFTEAQARLEEVQAAHRSYLQASWDEFLLTRATTSYEYVQPGVTLLREAALPEIEQAMAQRRTMALSGSGDGEGGETQARSALVTPIALRGQVIGALGLQEADGTRQWTADEIALVEAVADQMALAIENARLFEATQARAHRERLIREITGKVQGSIDLDTILQTTVQELGRALGASHAVVRLGTEAELSLSHQVEKRTVSTHQNDQRYGLGTGAEQKEM